MVATTLGPFSGHDTHLEGGAGVFQFQPLASHPEVWSLLHLALSWHFTRGLALFLSAVRAPSKILLFFLSVFSLKILSSAQMASVTISPHPGQTSSLHSWSVHPTGAPKAPSLGEVGRWVWVGLARGCGSPPQPRVSSSTLLAAASCSSPWPSDFDPCPSSNKRPQGPHLPPQ